MHTASVDDLQEREREREREAVTCANEAAPFRENIHPERRVLIG
jgi:hypothetical protein